jgi:hypothetical protein
VEQVDIVALTALRSSVEEEAPRLAADLGTTPYDTGLLLRSPPPVLLLRTDDRARALTLLTRLRERGHEAVACDAAAVVAADDMFHGRAPRFEVDALEVTAGSGEAERVAWVDVVALVRAMHRTRTEHVEKSSERKFSLGRAAMSGGVLLTKSVTQTTKHASEEREQVLYVFRRGGSPLFFTQSRTRYEGLGADLRPSQIENFSTLIRLLRERAPNAVYDERLLAPRPGLDRVRVGAVSGSVSASSSDGIDLLAHLIALAGSRAAQPYR